MFINYYFIISPSRIGQFEQGHVEKSLTVSIDILLQMLEPSRDPMLFIDALLKIINYENTYYRGMYMLCTAIFWCCTCVRVCGVVSISLHA